MKIMLVRPAPTDETIGLQHVMITEPLELEVLAALVQGRQDQVVIVDLIVEKQPFAHFLQQQQPDVVCVTGYITSVPTMIALCQQAKRRDPMVQTVVGGVHCEVCPEHLDHPAIDFRVVRNATRVFPLLLDHIRGQRGLPAGVFRPGQEVDQAQLPPLDFYYPRPDRSLTRQHWDKYFYIFHDRIALLKTAFGCPYSCTFCFCREITGDQFVQRPLDEVIAELQQIEQREIYIVDDDFLVSPKRLTAFLDALQQNHIDKSFLVYGRADFIAENRGLMERFKRQGLRTVIVGFESFVQRDLADYHKQTKADTNEAAMHVCNALGIDVFATLVVPPSWDFEDFTFHAKKFRQLKMNYINLQPLTPLPGTGLTARPQDLLLATGDFESWDLAHVALRPQKMGVQEFYRQIIKLYMATLYQPQYLASYLKYPPALIAKMLLGARRVRRQYQRKMRQARRYDVTG